MESFQDKDYGVHSGAYVMEFSGQNVQAYIEPLYIGS